MKFRDGQKVRVSKVGRDGDQRHVGQCGEVMTATIYGYLIRLQLTNDDAIFFESELEAV